MPSVLQCVSPQLYPTLFNFSFLLKRWIKTTNACVQKYKLLGYCTESNEQ